MITFKNQAWEKCFVLSSDKISFLVVENSLNLWEYCVELLKQSEGEAGSFYVNKNFKEESFEKLCATETNIAGFMLNTKKLQTALIKKCVECATSIEFEEELRKNSMNLYHFCKKVCQETSYSVELNEDIEIAGIFKLFSLTLKESYKSILDKLIEYINVATEFTKTKVFIFLFLTKFLTSDELLLFHKHCEYKGVMLILIEETLPVFLNEATINHQSLIIDKDGFEITKNFPSD